MNDMIQECSLLDCQSKVIIIINAFTIIKSFDYDMVLFNVS